MLTDSDERMAKFKAAIRRSRDGDLSALLGIDITVAELLTISALAKASDDAYVPPDATSAGHNVRALEAIAGHVL
jgi:hypothetical protein